MKTKENVLMEANKMIGRITLFCQLYEFSEEFLQEFEELKKVAMTEDVNKIEAAFAAFTDKYSEYVANVVN